MVERLQKRGVLIPSLLFAIIATLMLAKEMPTLRDSPHFTFYFGGRVFVIVSLLLCAVLASIEIEFIFLYYPIVFFFLAIFYECHGQYFQPNYWLAYIQVTSIFPFIFYLDKRLLAGLLIFGLVAFDAVLSISSQRFIDKHFLTSELYLDILTGTVISTLITYVGASVFFSEKMKKNQIYQRFIDLGKNVSSIVHDIKGMISGPCTYTDILYQNMTNGEISKTENQLVVYLKEDIYAIKDFVMEMNLLVSSHITDKENPVKISEVIKSIRKVFKSKIKNIRIELVGDMTLLIKIDYLNRILINSIVNSCEAIHKNDTKDGKIVVYCEEYLLGISDNSGENLDRETLKHLNSPYFTFTSKEQGSGIGLLLIKDYISAVGGKYRYYNHVNGVNLEIKFQKKSVLKSESAERRLI